MDWKSDLQHIQPLSSVTTGALMVGLVWELTKWGTLNLPNFTYNSTSIPYLMQSERFKKALFHGLFDSTNKTSLRYSSNDFGIQSAAKLWLSNTTNSSSNYIVNHNYNKNLLDHDDTSANSHKHDIYFYTTYYDDND